MSNEPNTPTAGNQSSVPPPIPTSKRATRLTHMMAVCILAAMMVGCGTTHVVDRKYQVATKYSQTEALEILRTALLKGGITALDLSSRGFSYKLALTRFGGSTPFTRNTITFAEITKVKSVRGPRGDFFYLYKEVGGREEECFQGISGRDDALADQVAAALFVLCPNLK